MKEYYAYSRVSTVRQGEHGSSLQQQCDAIRRYADHHRLHIATWFEERETAAKRGRSVFARMLGGLRRGHAHGVIIHKIDRSARNLKDWADLGDLIDRGVEVHFAHETLDLKSRGGRLSADIQAVVAADFIRNLRDEVRKGIYGRLKQGIYPLPAPLGYLDRGKARPKEPDPTAAPLVRHAFALYGSGHHSLVTLCDELHRLGLRNRRGGHLSLTGLSTMLNNPFYIGVMRIRRTGQTFPGVHEPLISTALFERVQAVLRGKTNTRVHRHDFLFRRRLRCAACGYTLVGERQKGHVYYHCHTRTCPATAIREECVEEQVGACLTRLQFTEAEGQELIRALAGLKVRWAEKRQQLLRSVRLTVRQLDERLDRLTDAYLDGAIDRDAHDGRRERLLRDRAAAQEKLGHLSTNADEAFGRVSRFLERAKSLCSSYDSANTLEKREFLDSVTSNLKVSAKNVEITLCSPFSELENRPDLSSSGAYRGIPRTSSYPEDFCTTLVKHFSERCVALEPS